jgi:hypothetical protein
MTEAKGVTRLRQSSWLHARFLSWKFGRRIESPYRGDGFDGGAAEQLPMRYADTGEPVTTAAESE